MKNIIVTTTHSIENCPVTKYLDFVCANIVLGTNVFSDISASFTDFFGGKSKTYQNKLELIQKNVISDLKENKRAITILINEMELFSAREILNLCKNGNHSLLFDILNANAPAYSKEDISIMQEIVLFYDSLPDTGKIENTKGGLFGKETQRFICQNGHKSSIDSEFCDNENCLINMKGIHKQEMDALISFKDKVRILNNLIKD